jgi:DNA-binding transcriptional ArsR family regulator
MERPSREKALSALSALAHETRLEIFRYLVTSGSQGVPAGQLGNELGLAPPTLSFHLKEMRLAGIVRSKKEGRCVLYSADIEAVRALGAYLTEDCCCRKTS